MNITGYCVGHRSSLPCGLLNNINNSALIYTQCTYNSRIICSNHSVSVGTWLWEKVSIVINFNVLA